MDGFPFASSHFILSLLIYRELEQISLCLYKEWCVETNCDTVCMPGAKTSNQSSLYKLHHYNRTTSFGVIAQKKSCVTHYSLLFLFSCYSVTRPGMHCHHSYQLIIKSWGYSPRTPIHTPMLMRTHIRGFFDCVHRNEKQIGKLETNPKRRQSDRRGDSAIDICTGRNRGFEPDCSSLPLLPSEDLVTQP